MPLSPAIREYAETPARFNHVVAGSSVERFDDGRVCVIQGTMWAEVSGVKVPSGELDVLIDQVRRIVPGDKEPMWVVGPSSLPANLPGELRRRGFESPKDRVGSSRALALVEEPEGPSGVDVRRVETFEQYVVAQEISWEAFEWPAERIERNRQRLAEGFEEMMRLQIPLTFLAYEEGKPAGSAGAVTSDRGVFLIGGSVASWARGRGIYRALVRARWDFAVERGTPALVTHANPRTSYPILRGLGFEEVCELQRFEDPGSGVKPAAEN
jgi:hypothetical protein